MFEVKIEFLAENFVIKFKCHWYFVFSVTLFNVKFVHFANIKI
jgi:hypothetical protein